MLNNAITLIACILMVVLTIDCFNRFFRTKEGLDTPPKETSAQKQQENEARSQLSPPQINSNNLKNIKRNSQEIKQTLSNLKETINNNAKRIKDQCCKINKKYKKENCNTTTKRMALPACQIKHPCKPCEPGSNNKDPHSCCPELIVKYK